MVDVTVDVITTDNGFVVVAVVITGVVVFSIIATSLRLRKNL